MIQISAYSKKFPIIILALILGAFLLALPLLLIQPAQSAAPIDTLPHPESQSTWLILDKTGPDTTYAGDPVRYTIRLTNTSDSELTNVVLTDTWTTRIPSAQDREATWLRGILALYNGDYTVNPPDAVNYHTYGSYVNLRKGEAYWHLNPIPAGQSVEIVLTMTTPITLQPALNGHLPWGRVGPSNVENSIVAGAPGRGNVEGPVVTSLVVGPLLQLTKTAVGEAAPTGQTRVGRLVTYTIQIQNVTAEGSFQRPDAVAAQNLVVWDEIPIQLQGTTYLTYSASQPGVVIHYNTTGYTLTWTFPESFALQPGENTHVYFTARVPAGTAYNPTTNLINAKNKLLAIADTMLKSANLASDLRSRVLSPFDKTVAASTPPAQANYTYPNRIVTYTVTIYNPLQIDIHDMVFTDTLNIVSGATYASMVQGPAPVSGGSSPRWEGLSLPANGAITLIFRAFIPPDVPLGPLGTTCRNASYFNGVMAAHPAFPVVYVGHDNNALARLYVVPQLQMSKTVTPTTQIPGESVVYTIQLQNVGDTDIPTPLIITDTLPLFFTYEHMVSTAPPGEPAVNDNVLTWNDVPGIPAGQSISFSFSAITGGLSGVGYKNVVSGYNAETSVCTISSAEVKLEIPITKVVSPTTVIQGEIVQYQAMLQNASTQDYVVTDFKDILPTGFVAASNLNDVYEITYDPPFTLPSNQTLTEQFDVLVRGSGVGTTWCNASYPSREVWQDKGKFGFNIQDTGWAYNTVKQAMVEVIPQGYLLQTSHPQPVAVNDTLVLTLTLQDNRIDPVTPLAGIHLKWTVPSYGSGDAQEIFTLLASSLPPAESSAPPIYYWEGLEIPLAGQLHIILELRAPQPNNDDWARDYTSTAEVLTLNDMNICIPRSSYKIKVVRGIEIIKTPSPSQVGPYGIVQYTLRANNLTGAPVSNVVLTDVLPPGWEFIALVSGPPPTATTPLVWHLDTIPALSEIAIKFTARAYTSVGGEINKVAGLAPINLGYHKNYTNTVRVQVVSGVGFFKTANPNAVNAGDLVNYTITLYNGVPNSEKMSNIIITDTLPAYFTFVRMLEGPAPKLLAGNELRWDTLTTLNNGQRQILRFEVRVAEDARTGNYYNQIIGEARSSSGVPLTIPPSGPTAPVYVSGLPSIQVNKQVSPNAVRAGNSVTYTLTLYNEAEGSYAVVVTDTLPYSLTFETALGSPQPTVIPGPRERVVWSGFDLAPGETRTLTFRASVDRRTPNDVYCNDVQVKMGEWILPPHLGLACLNVSAIPRVDAQISKDDGVTQVAAGDRLTYTIRYTNSIDSEAALYNVVLTETIAPLAYLTVLEHPNWLPLGEGRYRLEVSEPLSPGVSGEVLFVVDLQQSVPLTEVLSVHNRVEIGYTTLEETVEATPDDNIAEDINLWQGPDIIITNLWFEPANPLIGEPLAVHIELTNQGTSNIDRRYDGSTDPGWWLFVTELYLKNTSFVPAGPPTGVFDHIGGYCPDAACSATRGEYLVWPNTLAAGESRQFTFNITAPNAGVYSVYVQADVTWLNWRGGKDYGLILEAIEDNNIYRGSDLVISGSVIGRKVYLPLILRH